jgi:hypothetical protein
MDLPPERLRLASLAPAVRPALFGSADVRETAVLDTIAGRGSSEAAMSPRSMQRDKRVDSDAT